MNCLNRPIALSRHRGGWVERKAIDLGADDVLNRAPADQFRMRNGFLLYVQVRW